MAGLRIPLIRRSLQIEICSPVPYPLSRIIASAVLDEVKMRVRLQSLVLSFCFAGMAQTAFADSKAGLAELDAGNYEAAAKEFQASFDAGDGDGAFYLGRMFEMGVGTTINLPKAVALFEAAASKGSALGTNRLGLMYLDGQSVIRDFEKGTQLVCKAADMGEQNAQFNCGAMLSDGKGVTKDRAKALEYWQLASDQGQIAASNLLAQAYKTGDGIEADAAHAFELFSATAEQGNAMGLYEVALAYETGLGAEPDPVKAYSYANIAAARQHPDAPALRDKIEATLTAEQIAEGQKLARDWIKATEEAQAATQAAAAN